MIGAWSRALDTNREVITVGDYNIDLLEGAKKTSIHEKLYAQYESQILTRGAIQIVKRPTRFHSSCLPSLIDHVYTTNQDNIIFENIGTGTSDHNLIGVKRRNGAVSQKPRMIKQRVFANFKEKNYREELQKIRWEDVEDCEDLEEAVSLFTTKLTNV